MERTSETPTDTEKVKIKGREFGLKSKDYLNDEKDQGPYP
jgi:hypothetical protein